MQVVFVHKYNGADLVASSASWASEEVLLGGEFRYMGGGEVVVGAYHVREEDGDGPAWGGSIGIGPCFKTWS